MMKKVYLTLLSVILISCGENKVNEKEQTNKIDSVAVSKPGEQTFFEGIAFKTIPFPISIDSAFIETADTSQKIFYKKIRTGELNWLKNEISEDLEYQFRSFFEIDSLKETGQYADYLKKLDIGMTQNSIAFALGKSNFDSIGTLYIWGIKSESYPACPYHHGTCIIGSFVDANKKITHILLGEESAAGDPPSTGEQHTSSFINKDGSIESRGVYVSDDLDVEGADIKTIISKIQLKKDGIDIVKTSKEEKNSERPDQDSN